MTVSRDDILKALDQVVDPVSGRTVVQQDMISGLVVKDGHVGFVLEVAPGQGPQSEPLRKICEAMVLGVSGVKSVTAVLTAHDDHPSQGAPQHSHDHAHAPKPAVKRQPPPAQAGIPGVSLVSFGGLSVPNTILCLGSCLANSTMRAWKHQPDSQTTFGVSIAIQNASNE